MKVICEQCGKIFDYEKHDGICKKCGHYSSSHIPFVKNNNPTYTQPSSQPIPPRPLPTMPNLVDDEDNKDEWDEAAHINPLYNPQALNTVRTPEKKAHSTLWYIVQFVLSMIIVLFMLFLALGTYLEYKDTVKSDDGFENTGYIPPIKVEARTEFDYYSNTIAITDVSQITFDRLETPIGYKFVKVNYTHVNGEDSYYDHPEESYLFCDDQYYDPVNLYTLSQEMDMDYDELRDTYLLTEWFDKNKEGFLFLVPEDCTEYSFFTYVFSKKDTVKRTEKVYEIPLVEIEKSEVEQ